MTIGNGDEVRWNVSRDILRLGLDDGKGRERAAVKIVAKMGGVLQQPRMNVKDIAGKSFATRRAAKQQTQLAIGPRVMGEIVVNDEHIPASLHEVLRNAGRGVGCNVGEAGRVVAFSYHNNGVIHGALFAQVGDDLGDGGGAGRWQ